mgnify:CR=1 FL=1
MKHLSKLIETYLMPLSQKLSSNKYLVALRDGLMLSMPLLIVGSLAIVIGDFPVPAFHEFMTSIVGDVWNTWCWDMVNPATMGLVALFAVVGVSHSLASEEEVEPLPAVAISISAYFLLLQQIRDDVPPRVLIDPDGVFVDVVQQIEIKILHAALLQLPFEDIRHIICRRDLMAGELVRQIEALPRIILQNLPDDSLRLAGVIGPGGIEVVDALPDGGVGHGRGQFLVDAFVLAQRQPHRAESKLRKL